MTSRALNVIAREVLEDWKVVNPDARPYLGAMFILHDLNDVYMNDTARDIVLYFLSNAGSWRGPVARRIKAELNYMLKGK